RNTPPFSFLEHLLPQSGTIPQGVDSRGGANTSSASVDNNFNVYHPNNDNFKCQSLILLTQTHVFPFNRKTKGFSIFRLKHFMTTGIPQTGTPSMQTTVVLEKRACPA
ncbi:MAG: hypothetical protein PF692_06255, partial [Kiritimatiellae bacterium]|nr:hypothetical protein [Kiritimatiellia bacterium]